MTAALLAALVLTVGPVLADHHEGGAPPYMLVQTFHVDPLKMDEFEKGAQAWVEAFQEKEMGPEWTWYASTGQNFTYTYVSPIPNYAYLDTMEARQAEMAEALGPEKLGELMRVVGAATSVSTELVKAMPKMSYHPAEEVPGQFLRVGVHTVRPAMAQRFEQMAEKVAAAFAKAEAPLGFSGYQVAFGEGSYVFTTMAPDAATFYATPGTGQILAQALGEEGARELLAEWRECVTDYQTHDYQMRMDLSYVPMMGDEH